MVTVAGMTTHTNAIDWTKIHEEAQRQDQIARASRKSPPPLDRHREGRRFRAKIKIALERLMVPVVAIVDASTIKGSLHDAAVILHEAEPPAGAFEPAEHVHFDRLLELLRPGVDPRSEAERAALCTAIERLLETL